MLAIVAALAAAVPGFFRSHVSLQLENVALRHQLAVYQRRQTCLTAVVGFRNSRGRGL